MPTIRRDGVKAAVVQSRIDQGDKEKNWRRAVALARPALTEGVDLIVFPEAFVSGVNFIILRQMAEPVPGPTVERLSALAAEHDVHVVAGVLEAGDDGRIYDSAVVIDRAGRLLGRYRRRFAWVGERAYVSVGDGPVTVDTELGRIGLIVGYDLCFPEACATFLAAEVDVIACPASVFARLNHSAPTLARARAMDCHCYLLYANAVGFHQFANMAYTGRSGIHVDPYFAQVQLGAEPRPGLGTLAQAAEEETVLTATLHLDDLRAARVPDRLPFRDDAAYTLARGPAAALS